VTQLTVERLFSSPALSGSVPIQLRFSADGTRVAYLANPPEDRERLDLYCHDTATATTARLIDSSMITNTGSPTDAEKAERERRRQFSGGISTYRWLPDSRRICLVVDGSIHLYDSGDRTLRQLTGEGLRNTDLTVSGAGRYLSYVRDGDLYLFDLTCDREERLTNDASECVTNGIAEFIAQEEMHRFEGHWWSPDDRFLVFTRVDSSMIPPSHRYEFTASELVAVSQRYPYAGAANAVVDLGVLDLQTRIVRWIDYRAAQDDYLARINVGAGAIVVQCQSRNQRTLTVTAYPLLGGEARLLLTERQSAWVNLHDNFRFVGNGDFVWTSERTGTSHVYLYRTDGSTLELGGNRGRINEIVHADAAQVFVLGWKERPIEQHLFRITYDAPGELQQLTRSPGWHDVVVDPTGAWYADRHSSVLQPPCLWLRSTRDHERAHALSANALIEGHPYAPYLAGHVNATFGSIRAADGQELWYRQTLPPAVHAQHKCAVLVHVYGGPGVQRVRNEWAPLTNQLFAAAGIAVFELDNRGGTNRSKAFEDPICGRLGQIEVDDQLTGIEFLKQQPWLDPARIGVMGHSYGGFMALMLLARNRGDIRAGVSGAPVVDWRLYDTHYTERYLGTPEANPDGYRDSCVLSHADHITGALLLIHGMADDNVLFSNTTMLMHSLQARRCSFELMLYPGAKHSLQERDVAIHRLDTILDFLQRKLLA
jgi:dipeptidyl-peptidase-4